MKTKCEYCGAEIEGRPLILLDYKACEACIVKHKREKDSMIADLQSDWWDKRDVLRFKEKQAAKEPTQ